MNKYFTIITEVGKNKISTAIINNTKLSITTMAVGDGSGVVPVPSTEQRGLINETWRAEVNQIFIDPKNASQIIVEMIIPENSGGWWVREAGLFDEENNMIAVANCPETYKPVLAEGSGRNSIIRMVLIVSEIAAVELKTDPTTVIATRVYVNAEIITLGKAVAENLRRHEQSRNHPDATLKEKGFTRLSNDINSNDQDKAATPLAVRLAVESAIRSAWELDNPVGTVKFYAQNVNPNERYPWTEWIYTGENKTIRVGKASGSNVGQTGGSDTVTIERANLPAVQVDVTGETSELPARELTARPAGKHKHRAGMAAPGEAWDGDYIVGSDNDSRRPRNYTDEEGEHSHTVDEPAHKHTITGKTANLGEGKSFSVVEAHILLMCWARVA